MDTGAKPSFWLIVTTITKLGVARVFKKSWRKQLNGKGTLHLVEMSKLTLLLSVTVLVLAIHSASAYFPCSTDFECEQRLSVLKCDRSYRRCVCKSGYSQEETEVGSYYQIQCSKSNVVVIVVVVLVVLGLVAGGVTALILMKRRRMACFA